MPAVGTAALGTAITINGQAVGGVGDISGPGGTYDWSDTTAHDAPNRTETGVPTVKRTGEVTFPLTVDSSDEGQQDLLAAHEAIEDGDHDPDAFVVTYPDGGTRSFAGFVMGFESAAPVTGHLTADVTIRVTGAVTYVPAGS